MESVIGFPREWEIKKDETLIDRLGITQSEQKHLKTIIRTDGKYDRNNERRSERRNKDGLTNREQDKHNTIQSVKELYQKGYKQ